MSIFPGNIFTQRTNVDINSSTTAADINAAVSDANRKTVMEMLDNLSAGDTILGKVLSQSGKNLSILTQQGVTINAKNSSLVNFEKGTSILFEVQKANGRDISIRPLYQNTSIQRTAEVALRQAGIPINERSLEMTGRNMEYGNPIDRNSLIESYKDVALYPQASVKSIVDLQKMNIEITPENLKQYQAYMNMENSVTDAFHTISDNLIDDLMGRFANESAEGATGALSDILELFEANGLVNAETMTEESVNDLINMAKESGLNLSNVSNMIESGEEVSPHALLKAVLKDIENPSLFVEEKPEMVSDEPRSLLSFLGNDAVEQVPASEQDISTALADFLDKAPLKELAKRVFDSRWSVDSEKLTDKTEIKSLYDRLYNETRQMLEILNQNTSESSAAKESINNLKENIEFMNDLNQYIPYVQIPFHAEGSMHNSELYVYRNKKSLADNDSEVSAFIHLDMEHLGPTDVMVKLLDSKVSTNFTVKDEDTLLFIEHHLDLLERRIKEKGFSFDGSVSKKMNDKSPMEQMLSKNEQHLVLQETSFDARV